MATAADIRTAYARRAADLRVRRRGDARTVDRLGNRRLAAFVAAGLLVARWATADRWTALWLSLAVGMSAGFVALVRASNRAKIALQRTADLIGLAAA
mgnify:CR=1 FL=1